MAIWKRGDHRLPPAASDPYLEWAAGSTYKAVFERPTGEPEPWVPLLIELKGITAARFAAGDWRAPSGWETWLKVPPLYANPSAGLREVTFCTGTARRKFFAELGRPDSALSKVVKRVALGTQVDIDTTQQFVFASAAAAPATPGVVVTGIIDDGLACVHERLLAPGGARAEYLWQQDGTSASPGPGYGAEIVKRGAGGIDSLMPNCTHASLLDEEELYRVTRLLDFGVGGHKPIAWRGSHGAHVTDLACGFDGAAGRDRPLVAVQLPVATTADTSGGTLGNYVLDGLHYILSRADSIASDIGSGPLPVVVNLSYGLYAGPHDGSSILEAAIDQIIAQRNAALPTTVPMAVVLPAGNSRLARCHASFGLGATAQARTLHWRIQPEDVSPSYLEIWLPATAGAKVEVQVTPPGEASSAWIREGESHDWLSPAPDVRTLARVNYVDNASAGLGRNVILIAVAETATQSLKDALPPAGRWQVAVRNAGPALDVEAWIQRDDNPYGYPRRSRQSRFDDEKYNHVDDAGRLVEADNPALGSYVCRAGTINAIATGSRPFVVGGWQRRPGKPARYSGEGLPAGGKAGPDVVAPSDDSSVHYGIPSAGTRSRSTLILSGTSFASPQLAWWLADRMANGLPVAHADLHSIAAPVPGSTAGRSGYGMIDPLPRRKPDRFVPDY